MGAQPPSALVSERPLPALTTSALYDRVRVASGRCAVIRRRALRAYALAQRLGLKCRPLRMARWKRRTS